MKNITLILLLIVITTTKALPSKIPAIISPLQGNWEWADAPKSQTFQLTIKQQGNKLIGDYCATAKNGKRVDCSEDKNNVSFTCPVTSSTTLNFTFTSNFAGGKGDAQITYDGTYITWKIINQPKQEYYCPKLAKLKRVTSN